MKRLLLIPMFLLGCASTFESDVEVEDYLSGRSDMGVIYLPSPAGEKVTAAMKRQLNGSDRYHFVTLKVPSPKRTKFGLQVNDVRHEFNNAVAFLRSKKVKKIILMGHGLGARWGCHLMVHNKEVDGFVGMSMKNNGWRAMNCLHLLRGVTVPVLDVAGTRTQRAFREANVRGQLLNNNYYKNHLPSLDFGLKKDPVRVGVEVSQWVKQNYRPQTLMY